MSEKIDYKRDAPHQMTPPRHIEPTDRDDTGSSLDKERISHNTPSAPPPPRDVLIGPTVFSVISLVSLVFTAVSICIPWFRKQQYKPNGLPRETHLFYLFKHVTKVEQQPDVVTYPNNLCTPVQRRVRGIEAFSFLSSVMTLIMFILSVVNAYKQSLAPDVTTRNVMLVFTACAVVSLTIEVSLSFNVYLWSFAECGAGTSYHSQLYEPYIGFGLTVTAWVLTTLGSVIATNELTVPLDARTVGKCIHAFAMLSLVAFLFALVASPIPHWFYKDGTTNTVTDVLLWRVDVGNFNWNTTAAGDHSSTSVGNLQCPSLTRHFRAAEAFSIASILFNMLTGMTGLLMWKSLAGSHLPAIVFCYIGMIVTLIQLALELTIYYGSWCDGKYAFHERLYVLSSGFGLVASSFCIMVVSCFSITVAYYLTRKYFPALIPRRTAKEIVLEACR
ncbi:hypothetical protein JKF63_06105 [Porcisia hertigi]|uniref:Uncharacterized protein n=1 Tax=Porcisia hertigi TaxID=2761500 RepID=A0A836IWN3_9TRYP|nr:hypothetical protein JKF63_06105 [Porcisia hertigi]